MSVPSNITDCSTSTSTNRTTIGADGVPVTKNHLARVYANDKTIAQIAHQAATQNPDVTFAEPPTTGKYPNSKLAELISNVFTFKNWNGTSYDTWLTIGNFVRGILNSADAPAFRTAIGATTSTDFQSNVFTGFTTAGTSTAYTLTPSPSITAYTARTAFDVTFHTASGAAPTIQISGLATPPNLVKQVSAGTYTNIALNEIPANHVSKVVLLSATQALVVTMPPAATTSTASPQRQTVLDGPINTSGLPTFGGATGGTSITMSGTLEISAANGPSDRRASITNAAWTGFSTNGTHYMFLEANADGTCTPIRVTLAPTYRWAGADVVTNNQHTFNESSMQMKVGNGSTATQVFRVCVGEAVVSGGVVSSITWYSINGRYESALQNVPAAETSLNMSHLLGRKPNRWSVHLVNNTSEFGYAVGVEVPLANSDGDGARMTSLFASPTTVSYRSSVAQPFVKDLSGAGGVPITAANWRLIFRAWAF